MYITWINQTKIFLYMLLLLLPIVSLPAEETNKLNADLIRALERRNIREAERLIAEGADPNSTDNRGRTALMFADRPESVRILLQYGADPTIADNEGNTAMHGYFFGRGIRSLLAKAGADIEAANHQGITPLMREVSRSFYDWRIHRENVNELLALGADPHKKTPEGKNLLLLYLENHSLSNYTRNQADPAMVQLLLDLGIDPSEADQSGRSAHSVALLGDRDNDRAREIQAMFKAAANRQGFSAARRQARAERRIEFFEDAPYRLSASAYTLIPLGYLGFSIAAREGIFRDNPDANWMGNVNTFVTGFVLGSAISSLPFVVWIGSLDGWDRLLPVLLGLVVVPTAGIITGVLMSSNPEVTSAFTQNPVLYYFSPALAGIACIPILFYIWRY